MGEQKKNPLRIYSEPERDERMETKRPERAEENMCMSVRAVAVGGEAARHNSMQHEQSKISRGESGPGLVKAFPP